jgi:uncharacterized OsmC-like protein
MSIQTVHAEIKSAGKTYKVECSARNKSLIIDEPEELGGSDGGMNPGEAFLCSLGSCKYVVAKMFCEKLRINLQEIKIDMAGEIDRDGMTGMNKHAKVGYSNITTKYYIKANNSKEEIEKFVEFIEDHCPMKDTIYNRPEMDSEINIL